jgi:dynein heavy chain, axonemal
LTANIRDKFIEYDRITAAIEDLPKSETIGPIEIRFERINESLLDTSKEWKTILGQKLSEFYKTILERMVEFIHDKQKILSRPLKDLDDVRLAMECLESIRENFLAMDMDLTLMEDTYALFNTFQISIPVEDTERVDGLRYNFGTMIKNVGVKNVS